MFGPRLLPSTVAEPHRYVAPYNVAVIYAGLGEKDEAFRWL
jgi:hypothetical protein